MECVASTSRYTNMSGNRGVQSMSHGRFRLNSLKVKHGSALLASFGCSNGWTFSKKETRGSSVHFCEDCMKTRVVSCMGTSGDANGSVASSHGGHLRSSVEESFGHGEKKSANSVDVNGHTKGNGASNSLSKNLSADALLSFGSRVGARQENMSTLVLMRHGESMWNSLKLFTGDVDIPLTENGVHEALAGGKAIGHIEFDMIFTSRLVRSKQTALIAMTQSLKTIVPVIVRGGYYGKGKTGDDNRLRLREAAAQALEHAECHMIPVYADQALNERCYGDLQGLNKEAAMQKFGKEMVSKWRRSHDTRPPKGESLVDTWDRCTTFFDTTIEPRLKEGSNVLIVAHGNVLRCIISHISGLSVDEMLRLQVVTALPYTYSYNGSNFAECCVLPPIDPETNLPMSNSPLGLSSARKKDSLI